METQLRDKPRRRAAVRSVAARRPTKGPKARGAAPRMPAHDEIALRAHALYVQAGCVHGRDQEFWLEAERQLLAERKG